MSVTLDPDKKAAIFRSLASATLYDVGIEFGLDKQYKDVQGVRNRVYAIYREVANDPGKYSVHPDTVELVQAAVSKRRAVIPKQATLAEKQYEIDKKDVKALTLGSRDAAVRLVHKKLEYLEKHPKALNNESLVSLGKIFGILFDKGQIIQGQATEHVALMGKIDENMSAEDAIQAVLRTREVIEADKHG